MSFFPASLETLIDKFASLPGIGRKSAQRLAFHVLSLPEEETNAFATDKSGWEIRAVGTVAGGIFIFAMWANVSLAV